MFGTKNLCLLMRTLVMNLIFLSEDSCVLVRTLLCLSEDSFVS